MRNFIKKFLLRRDLAKKLKIYGNAYLRRKGWHESYRRGSPTDRNGGPIPWITYPALMMLRQVVARHHKVFEYGCGNSSLWWAKHVFSVVSVEHDPAWAERISLRAPPNLKVITRKRGEEDPGEDRLVPEFFARFQDAAGAANDQDPALDPAQFRSYAGEIAKHGKDHFDIVVVDGVARNLAAWMALHFVKADGIIIFDNSERSQYNPGFELLSANGFRRVDFYGTGPLATHETCTSIFSKNLEWAAANVKIDGAFTTD